MSGTRPARRRKTCEETSAGGVVYRRAERVTLFLVIRDSYKNWGFPKGHLRNGEAPGVAALREVAEETGLTSLAQRAELPTIDWHFHFRGRRVHKVCHFFLYETGDIRTRPEREEGITECRWAPYEEAARLISYANARAVLARAQKLLEAKLPVPGLGAGDSRPATLDSRRS